MSITQALNAAKTGLLINGQRAETVATNVANASTPGYVRRSLNVAENLYGGQTSGVKSTGVARHANVAITTERRSTASDLSQARVMSAAWQTLSAKFGNTSDATGIFGAFSTLESALADARTSPESSTSLHSVYDAANDIISAFREMSATASSLRAEADLEIATGVETVNAALKQIEVLNGKISSAKPDSAGRAGLMDERQRLLDTIAEYMPVKAVPREGGAIDVITPEGVFLLNGAAQELTFTQSQGFDAEYTLENGALSGLMVGDQPITPGTPTYAAVSSGRFAALFSIRDTDVPGFSAQLDALAGDLISRLSADGIDPTKASGEPGLFVDPDPGAPGLAERITLNAAIDPQQGGQLWRIRDGVGAAGQGAEGNASILSGLYDAFTQLSAIDEAGIQGNFSSVSAVAHMASLLGQSRIQSEAAQSSVATQYGVLVEAEQAEAGVNIDEQMQQLLVIEQAYAANARVIEAARQMLDRLMEI